MTKDLYLNILYSIRYFLHEIPDLNVPWYFTQNIPFTDDSFVEATGAMMDFSQETNEWNSFININVYSKTQVNEITAAIVDGLGKLIIPLYNFLEGNPDNLPTLPEQTIAYWTNSLCDELWGTSFEGVEERCTTPECLEIERIVTTALGQLDSGHAVNNISVYYKILTR